MAEPAANKAVIKHIYDVYSHSKGHDISPLMAALAPDAIWRSLGPDDHMQFARNGQGDEHIRTYFRGLHADWEQLRVDPHLFLAEGDHVIVIGQIEFRHKGTGRVLTTPKVDSWRLNEDGQIVEFCEYFDTLAAVVAAGGLADIPVTTVDASH